jgi:hypothetical protein
MMHLRRLRLTGPDRQYLIDFDKRGSNLALITGEISTGKTTILELIKYMLGGEDHPPHPELARKARSCELELTIEGKTWTIERPLFSHTQTAYIREGALDESGDRQRKLIEPTGDPDSLSRWLLDPIGMGESKVRVTDGNPNSPTNALSIRDVMWLTYLPSTRLDNEELLHENHPQKAYKFRQLIEMSFDIHDDRLGQLLEQQKKIREELRAAEQEADNLRTFLLEEKVLTRPQALERRSAVEQARTDELKSLAELSRKGAATTGHADALRREFAAARHATAQAAAQLLDRQTLLDRLMRLRGQYAEDERKLVFADEAQALFDPLHVEQCPACLNDLPEPVERRQGECSLCSQTAASENSDVFSVKVEHRRVRARIKDLNNYATGVEAQVLEASTLLEQRQEHESVVGSKLDSATAAELSPFVAERDERVKSLTTLESEDRELIRTLKWHDALSRRTGQAQQLRDRLNDVRRQLDELRTDQPGRADVITRVSGRFASLLREWNFPKVDDEGSPRVDDKFVPYLGDRVYRSIGSDGAKTLISLAWTLAIFELVIESGGPHPGFLLLDSVQKNLAPTRDRSKDDEYTNPAIYDRMYSHVQNWLEQNSTAQIIIVDHEPPTSMKDHEVVHFSGDRQQPPYGLIDDETGR